MYLRKCETRRPSAGEKYVRGELDCDEVVETDGTLNVMCWSVSGNVPCRVGDVTDVVGDSSSNRSRTITLGSDLLLLD